MKMIKRLKEETRILHEEIEAQNLAKQIMDHSIRLETYQLLLLQNYIAYRETEKEIQKFIPGYAGKKHLQLKQDLKQLNVSAEIPLENAIFECHSKAEALGAAYVVEGSALGGLLLAKNIKNCTALAGIEQHYFFNGDKNNLHDWNNFKEELENYEFSKIEEEEAIEKAKETFRFFKTVFNMDLMASKV